MARNIRYLYELTEDNLLLHFRREAGLCAMLEKAEDCHWGWDSPLSDLRGQVTGHWLSAAARTIRQTGDTRLKAKADYIVSEIARCQNEHGDGWMFPIPEKSLYWLKRGKHSWAPQYVCHKCMLGMLEMYTCTGNKQALDVLLKAADWFDRFTADITPEKMDDMMDDEETGGMMELFADLYAVTGEEKHLRLMRLYARRRLFEPLLRGEDVLTNMHANTTIPEIHGACRAYEVTGETYWRDVALAYWKMAVTGRGMYATGGQTSGELWTPPGMQAARLSDKTQEHCAVYNMIRLADYLLRWTGEKEYADYIERNLWNGILAQGYWQEDKNNEIDCDIPHKDWQTGLVTYYLPLKAGARKRWAHRTHSFWCCVDTLMQANAMLADFSLYTDGNTLYVEQYHPVTADISMNGIKARAAVRECTRTDSNIRYSPVQREYPSRPAETAFTVSVTAEAPLNGKIMIRLPWWTGEARVISPLPYTVENGYITLSGDLSAVNCEVILPRKLTVHPLPDEPDTVAFLEGPVVLAGLCDEERTLYGEIARPETILRQADERRWQTWQPHYKTHDQPVNFDFVPICEIGNETYTVYFPVRKNNAANA